MAEGEQAPGQAAEAAEEEEEEVRWGEDEYGKYRIDDKAWTMNEIRDHPMFMEDVPSDISDNPHLLALQSLVYDDQTPEELAEHFKKLGNEAFRTSTNNMASQNALAAYTKGLEMECSDQALNSQLHSNRAAVSSRLGQHAKAVDDCRKAIKLDPTNAKAYYRAAKASDALKLTEQALKFCQEAAKACEAQKDLQQLAAKLKQQLAAEERERERQRRADEQAALESKGVFAKARTLLEARGVQLGNLLFDVAMYAQGATLRPTITDDEQSVEWPLLFLYDETGQSDFVQAFDERCTLEEMLQMMFPPDRHADWDEEGKYVWDRLAVYLEYYPEGEDGTEVTPVDPAKPLQSQLDNRRVPPCLGLHVLVRGTPAWAHFCQSNGLPPA